MKKSITINEIETVFKTEKDLESFYVDFKEDVVHIQLNYEKEALFLLYVTKLMSFLKFKGFEYEKDYDLLLNEKTKKEIQIVFKEELKEEKDIHQLLENYWQKHAEEVKQIQTFFFDYAKNAIGNEISQEQFDKFSAELRRLQESERIHQKGDLYYKEAVKKVKHLFPLENTPGINQIVDKTNDLHEMVITFHKNREGSTNLKLKMDLKNQTITELTEVDELKEEVERLRNALYYIGHYGRGELKDTWDKTTDVLKHVQEVARENLDCNVNYEWYVEEMKQKKNKN